MKYLFSHQLTNDNLAIQNKARYFADTLIFLHNNPCQFGFPQMESQRSLLSKIAFRLKHFNGNTSVKYIDHFLNNVLLRAEDTIISEHYKSAIPVLDELRKKTYKTDLSVREILIEQIEQLTISLQKTLFQHAMDDVISVLHCPEDLEEHNHIQDIEYAAGIMNAELQFIGFPEKDADKILTRILTREVVFKKNKVQTPFPLPAEILEKRKHLDSDEKYFEAVSDFMENRTLKEQFQGIYNLYQNNDRSCKLLFRINNLKSKKRLSKTYGAVKLTTSYKSYVLRKMNERYEGFFSPDYQVFLEVTVDADDIDTAKVMAIDHINSELPLFDQFYYTRLQVDFSNFVMKNNEGYFLKLSFSSKWLNHRNSDQMRLERAIEKACTLAARDFQYFEKLYASAETSTLRDQKVNNYWRYIESAFNGSNADANKIMDYTAIILANHRILKILYPYHISLSNMLIANGEEIEGPDGPLKYIQIKDIVHKMKWTANWLTETNQYANSPFITHHLTPLFHEEVNTVHKQLINYYHGILMEAYEQRNYIQHDSIYHPMALQKLVKILPSMVSDLRYLISKEIIKGRNSTYKEIIHTLIQPDKKLEKIFKKKLLVSKL